MGIYNSTQFWYTDLFSVYRNKKTETLGISNTERTLVAENCIGRIYRKSNAQINLQPQAAGITINENLMCDIDVDIEAGDEIRVIRGYKINKYNKPSSMNLSESKCDVYICGQPVNYYTPYGGIAPDVQHKQVPLTNQLRTNAKYKE